VQTVRVVIAGDLLRISHAGREVAGSTIAGPPVRAVLVDPVHFDGVVGSSPKARLASVQLPNDRRDEAIAPLLEYERVVGGRW